MSLEQDVAAARRAVDALEQACGPLTRRFGDTVDARRLRIDVARLRDDLNLLCGAARGREIVGDRPTAAVFWDDGYDEGISGSGRTAP
ncbi:MAG TPA: hypothetical protein VHF92_19570 [Geodermatophilus sp.]|nr:hypothetical protein [Geodermatophilus sp.]